MFLLLPIFTGKLRIIIIQTERKCNFALHNHSHESETANRIGYQKSHAGQG
jgi:hypothetical protein